MHTPSQRITVWDPFIRAFHWTLVIAYLLAWFSAEECLGIHEQLGYFVLMLLGLRLIWGLIGTQHARFRNFVRTPTAALTYLRSLAQGHAQDYVGHNPAAGWMVIGLIIVLVATAATGIVADGSGELWEELHEALANISLLLIVVHIVSVIASSVMHGENLIVAMFTRNKTRNRIDA